jgi:hypothetical protein
MQAVAGETPSTFTTIDRALTLFDTSSIPDTDTISSGTVSLYGFSKGASMTNTGFGPYGNATPASNTSLAASDYGQIGATQLASEMTIVAFSTSAYNAFTLNASGLAVISKTGVTKIGWRLKNDADNSAPTWAEGGQVIVAPYSADQAGTANDPKLVVTHAPPPATGPDRTKAARAIATQIGSNIASRA